METRLEEFKRLYLEETGEDLFMALMRDFVASGAELKDLDYWCNRVCKVFGCTKEAILNNNRGYNGEAKSWFYYIAHLNGFNYTQIGNFVDKCRSGISKTIETRKEAIKSRPKLKQYSFSQFLPQVLHLPIENCAF